MIIFLLEQEETHIDPGSEHCVQPIDLATGIYPAERNAVAYGSYCS